MSDKAPSSPATGSAPVVCGRASSGLLIYTCPMHPEVRRDHSGACSKGGMTLELETPLPELEGSDMKAIREAERRIDRTDSPDHGRAGNRGRP